MIVVTIPRIYSHITYFISLVLTVFGLTENTSIRFMGIVAILGKRLRDGLLI